MLIFVFLWFTNVIDKIISYLEDKGHLRWEDPTNIDGGNEEHVDNIKIETDV